MFGLIKTYNPETQTGTITNGKETFKFEMRDWIPAAPPEQGDEVAFDLRGVTPFNINLIGALSNKDDAVKRRWLAVFLAFFFGWTGIHRFYLGYKQIGFSQILMTAGCVFIGKPGFAFLWGFVDAFLIFSGHVEKDAKGRPLK